MDQTDTKARIVDAAIEVFLEKGYNSATIRDICARAEANLAAVNYHFGSKGTLRAAALERVMASCHEKYPLTEGIADAPLPEDRLRRFIRNLLRLVIPADPDHSRRSKLVWQELDNPCPDFSPIVESFIRPIKDLLDAILLEIVGPSAAETSRLCVASIVGQCYFHAQNKMLITQLFPEKNNSQQDVDRLADHVCQFSLAGLEAVRNQAKISR